MEKTTINFLHLGDSEYHIQKEELDRESVDAVIGFGQNGTQHIPVLVLPMKFGDRKQYDNINTTSGWSVLTNNGQSPRSRTAGHVP